MPSTITVLSDENEVCLASDTEKTLLDTLEQQGIPIEYQCREGYCGSCRVKLVAGEVQYLTEPLAFVADSNILICCCRSKGDVVIEISHALDIKN